MRVISQRLYKVLVEENAEIYRMFRMIDEENTFQYFPFIRYATDVTFQMGLRPSGNIQEGKRYFSQKHNTY